MSTSHLSPLGDASSRDISSSSTIAPISRSPSIVENSLMPSRDITDADSDIEVVNQNTTSSENDFHVKSQSTYSDMIPRSKKPLGAKLKTLCGSAGKLHPFRLLGQDIRNIRRRYLSDWTTFNQLVFASAIYVFFTNILPGITFASDLYVLTGQTWGTIEVVFSTGLCGSIFALFSSQPLTILGVTGPFSVLAEDIYELCQESFHVDFLQLMAWSLIHAAWMHYLLAIFNAHDWTMQYVTTFSADIFSLLNSVIYFHKAIQELQRSHASVSFASFLYSIIGCIETFLVAVVLSTTNSWAPLFYRYIRMGLAEYAAAISIILFIGTPHIGAIITILFYFDHEISSIIYTLPHYGTKKPGGFTWDIALLGTTTAICGILGIPPANGLLPQALLHSESLLHTTKYDEITITEETGERKVEHKERQEVYEQRFSPFLQNAGILLFLAPPFQHLLG